MDNKISYFRFVLECIMKFFDCVVGNPNIHTPQEFRFATLAVIGGFIFGIGFGASLFYIDKKLDFSSKLALTISIAFGAAVYLLFLLIVYLCIFR